MTKAGRLPFFLLLAVCFSAVGYFFYRARSRRASLLEKISLVESSIAANNKRRAQLAAATVRSIRRNVCINREQVRDRVVLENSRQIQARTTALVDTLYLLRRAIQTGNNAAGTAAKFTAHEDQLRCMTGNHPAPDPLRHTDEASAVTHFLGTGTRQQRALAQQMAAFGTKIRALGLTGAPAPETPTFDNTPLAEALAALTHVESTLLEGKINALSHVNAQFRAKFLKRHLVAVVTADSDRFTPGSTYRGQLRVLKSLSAAGMRMECNGQAVAIDAHGVGQVAFRAAGRPGPAARTGTIRYNQNGRDTTFQVRVPYRIAQR